MATEYITHIVDAGHIRNIGEQSITNKIQAVLEIVKNAYDGDALTCAVRFYGEKTRDGDIVITKIEIEDSGVGMTKNDIKNKLMKVGTPNKMNDTYSPKFGRRVSGAKGMGHYSMQRLGTKTRITTTPEQYSERDFHNDNCTYILEIDWDEYTPGKDFQSISHKLTTQKKDAKFGTKIEIFGLKDSWNVKNQDGDIHQLSKVLGNIMLPKKFQQGKKDEFIPVIEQIGFNLEIQEPSGNLLDYASYKIEAFLHDDKVSLKIFRRKKNGIGHIKIITRPKSVDAKCGDANFTLYWFSSRLERWAKGLFNSRGLETQLKENHGVKIYNDGIRIMPYGEKDNDWLGLDARKAWKRGGRVHNAGVIGILELTREKNPRIIEATSREAINKNEAFESLKCDFALEVIEIFEEEIREVVRKEEEIGKKTEPGNIAQTEINRVKKMINEFEYLDEDGKKAIDSNLTRAYNQIHAQEQQKQKIKEELTANIEMYRNLATVGIQTIAFNHEIIDPVSYVKATLTNLNNSYDELTENNKKKYIAQSLERITYTLNWASHIKEFSSILAGADNTKRKRETVNINKTLLGIKSSLGVILNTLDITMDDPIIIGGVSDIRMNKASFESIFINLISNSVRALKKIRGRKRKIKIKIHRDATNIIFEFEDNGYGISSNDRDYIFRPFFTTYKNPEDRGTGMGLTILRDIVETDYNGSAKLKDTVYEKDDSGKGMARFMISLPLSEVKLK